ncbi:MAG: 50S ribosomal protein L24 [Candidatus Cloacimonadota bacterium]|jgi:large subunit ribosomal protein L24|nr:MAG: 50S ribosomal protein L24 [Candidatus Cloacimonadota bacterium]
MKKIKQKLKKGDHVLIISGEDRGKKGKILSIDKTKNKIIVEGANLIKKHVRPRKQGEQGGIIEKEGTVHVSNLKLICPKCGEPTRIQKSALDNQKRVRVCNKCGEFID